MKSRAFVLGVNAALCGWFLYLGVVQSGVFFLFSIVSAVGVYASAMSIHYHRQAQRLRRLYPEILR